MFCTSCGSQISDNAKFCPKCGHVVNPSAVIKPAPQEPPRAPSASVTPASPAFPPIADDNTPAHGAPDTSANRYPGGDNANNAYEVSAKNRNVGAGAYPGAPVNNGYSGASNGYSAAPANNGYSGVNNAYPGTPDADPFGRAPEKKGFPKAVLILIIAVSALLIAAAAFLGILSLKDRKNINAVKEGNFGGYTDVSVQEFLYDLYSANNFDTAVWEGRFSGLHRDVALTFSNSNGQGGETGLLFRMGKDGSFKLLNEDGEEIPDARFRIYNEALRDACPENYAAIADSYSYKSAAYGASPDYEGDRSEICRLFGDDPDPLTIAEFLQDDSAEIPEEPAAEDVPEDGANEPVISAGRYFDVSGQPCVMDVAVDNSDPSNPVYTIDVTCYQSTAALDHYTARGVRSEENQPLAIVFDNGSHRRELRINAQETSTADVESGVSGSLIPDGDQWVFTWGYDGLQAAFDSQEREIVIPEITVSVTMGNPFRYAPLTVISAAASSTIEQDKANITNDPLVMFDRIDETSWQEGAAGYGIGESVTFRLDGVREIEGLAFKMGNWRSDKYYEGNASPKTLTIVVGDQRFTANFERVRSEQYMVFSSPVYGDSVTIIIEDVHPGTQYEDTCINEITPYGRQYE